MDLFDCTWLFDNKQDGFATSILIVLETFHTIILIFVRAVHSICVMEHCIKTKEWFIKIIIF